MKQEKESSQPGSPGESGSIPRVDPASIIDKFISKLADTSRLLFDNHKAASIDRPVTPSPIPEIKQESLSPSTVGKDSCRSLKSKHPPIPEIKPESYSPSTFGKLTWPSLELPSLPSASSCTLLGDEDIARMKLVDWEHDFSLANITPDPTPEPEDAESETSGTMPAQPLISANILTAYGPAEKRLLLFDYDGTLTDIVADPEKAVLSPIVILSLIQLAEERKNEVWIISGRDQIFLAKQFGDVSALGLVAEHGAFIKYPETNTWLDLTHGVDMSWKHDFIFACHKSIVLTPGSRIETKRAAVVWHYRLADPQDGAREARKLKKRLKNIFTGNHQVEITEGKCVIEARLSFVHKGAIVQRLLTEFNIHHSQFPDFVLCVGDDITDEGMSHCSHSICRIRLTVLDMFQTLLRTHKDVLPEEMFAVTVGTERLSTTHAAFFVSEPRDVIENIMMLNQADLTDDVAGVGLLMDDGITNRGSKPLPVPRSYLL